MIENAWLCAVGTLPDQSGTYIHLRWNPSHVAAHMVLFLLVPRTTFRLLPSLVLSGLSFFIIGSPPPKECNFVLHSVDDVADNGEDDEEDDDYNCYDDVSFDHFVGR